MSNYLYHSYNNINLKNNIKIIGGCNPYKKKINNGLDKENELAYSVNPLPQSLMHYAFNFGEIKEEEEKGFILSFINELFDDFNENIKNKIMEIIVKCNQLLR